MLCEEKYLHGNNKVKVYCDVLIIAIQSCITSK